MLLIKCYKNIFSFLRIDLKFILFVLLFLTETLVYSLVNSKADISQYLSYYEENRPQYESLFSFIFFENMQAMLQPISFGFIPFFLGTIFHSVMGASIIITSCKHILLEISVGTFIIGILPHGIFEIPAMVLSVILSSIISKEITLALLSFVTKKNFDNPKAIFYENGLKETAVFAAETIIFILIPLVFLGAFTEIFVTGHVLEIVM